MQGWVKIISEDDVCVGHLGTGGGGDQGGEGQCGHLPTPGG